MSTTQQQQEYYTVGEVARLLKVSADTVARRFADMPGVLNLGSPETRFKRRYSMLRIPRSALNQFIAKVQVQ